MPTRLFIEEDKGDITAYVSRNADEVAASRPTRTAKLGDLLTPEEREEIRWYLETYLTSPYGVWEEQGRDMEARLPLLGQKLFSALFGPGMPTRDLYQQVKGEGLELWISSLDPVFLGMPWELMQDPENPDCLALAGVPVSRTIPGANTGKDTREFVEPLRVLMAICRPHGKRDVPYQIVARRLIPIMERLGAKVELDLLRPPTEKELWKRIEAAKEAGRPYHVLHFDGHGALALDTDSLGAFNQHQLRDATRKGYVVFEDDKGEAHRVAADDFARRFREAGIPLLVLNACRSAMVDADAPPDSVVATRLLQAGVPAVVAMGYSVYARAAAEFMAVFYDALFAGLRVCEAVARGRERLKINNLRPSPKGDMALADWMVPVHYASRYIAFKNLAEQPEKSPTPQEAMDKILAKSAEGEGEKDELAGADAFFGRDDEFLDLERALRVRHVVLLHGIGGSGKTELAKAFGRWFRISGGVDQPHWVIFQSFEPGRITHTLDGYLTNLGLVLFGPDFIRLCDSPEKRRAGVLAALEQKRILLVWDNFESVRSMPDPNAVLKGMDEEECAKIKAFLDEAGRRARVGVLITSRSEEGWLGGPERIARQPVLGLLPQDADLYAEHLLAGLSRAQEQRRDPDFPNLMKILAGHPLSLRLVLPFLNVVPLVELKEGLLGRGALPPGLLDRGAGRTESLAASVAYSLDHLPEPHASRLLALALFQGVVDRDILWVMSKQEGVPFRFAGISQEQWEESLSLSGRTGLLTQAGLGIIWRIHPALPAFFMERWQGQAKGDMEEELQAAREAWVRAHTELGSWLHHQIRGGKAEVAFAVLEACRDNLSTAAALALERKSFIEAQSILQPLNEYWDARGLAAEAKEWVDRCLDAVEGPAGEIPTWNSPAGSLWMFVQGTRANRKLSAGDLEEAEKAYKVITAMLEAETSPEARRHLATLYQQLGTVAQKRGELAEAEAWYHKALEIREDIKNRFDMASTYHQLGIVAQNRRDLDKAEGWYRNALEIEEELGNRPGMAISYHQLGNVAQELGDLDHAEGWYIKSLKIQRALGDRPGMAACYHHLGTVAQVSGRLAQAESWYRKSMEINEGIGNRHHMAMSYIMMGRLEAERNNPMAGLEWVVHCVSLFKDFPHPLIGPAPQYLAVFTKILGMDALAATWRKVSGKALPDHVRKLVEKEIFEIEKKMGA